MRLNKFVFLVLEPCLKLTCSSYIKICFDKHLHFSLTGTNIGRVSYYLYCKQFKLFEHLLC